MSENYQLITDTSALVPALERLRGAVAVDTEFHAEHRYLPALMLIQLRGESGPALVIDAAAFHDLSPIGRALNGRRLLLHAATQDLRLLRALAALPVGQDIVDVQVLAGFSGMGYPQSLGALLTRILDVRENKSLSLSNWSRRPLSHEQMHYAAADVLHLHDLAARLEAGLTAPRRALATEATRELLDDALRPVDPESAWTRIRAAVVADGIGREVLRRLAAWREQEARARNMQVWQVISDAILMDLARRRPRNPEALRQNRKLPRRIGRKYAEVIFEAIEAALATPPGRLPPTIQLDANEAALDALLAAWAFAAGTREGIAPRLLLPDDRRRQVLRAWSEGDEIGPALGWRATAFEAEIKAILSGRSGLIHRAGHVRVCDPE